MNYIDIKAKCSHLKKFTSKGFAAGVYFSEAPPLSPPRFLLGVV
jgi:hypothetical protein